MTQNVALIADIGGTHARFALVLPDETIAHTDVIAGGDFTNMTDVCRHYIETLPSDYTIRHAAWAVAGPMIDGRQVITNRGWSFTAADMQDAFGWDTFEIINDFAAQAMALPHLNDSDKMLIKPGLADPAAPLLVIGPGTGLGVGSLLPLPDGDWQVLPGEGGHVTLAATNNEEAAIIAALHDEFDVVMAERVLSGQGLVNLYKAMVRIQNGSVPVYDTPQAIREAVMQRHEEFATRVLAQFCRFLGAVAGDAALTMGARGGVYLAGGILPRMVEVLIRSDFAKAFTDKDVVAPYLQEIPIWLITQPFPAFVGLKFLLQKKGMVKTG